MKPPIMTMFFLIQLVLLSPHRLGDLLFSSGFLNPKLETIDQKAGRVSIVLIPVFDQSDKLHYLHVSDIVCVHKEDSSRKMVLFDGMEYYYAASTVKHYELFLSPHGFFRIDKNHIVNTTKIDKFANGQVYIGDRVLPVSRRLKDDLKSHLKHN